MAAEARSVLVLDHHKTAQEDLAAVPWPWHNWPENVCPADNLAAVFDMKRSGAGITWDHFHRKTGTDGFDEPRPYIIDLIEDRDLWRFRFGDESRAFHLVGYAQHLSARLRGSRLTEYVGGLG